MHPSGIIPFLCCHYYYSSHFSLYFLLFLFNYLFSINFSLESHILHCTKLCPNVISILSPPPPFLFSLGYVMYLVKLTHYLTWPHHHLIALLYFYMCASVNYSLMKAALGCRNVWIIVSKFWLVQQIIDMSLPSHLGLYRRGDLDHECSLHAISWLYWLV